MSEDDYRGLSADEGLQRLQGDFAQVKPDLAQIVDRGFPGPVAEALYWDDSSVVAIVGPVGSGKTTTVLYSRLRRAIMMPISTIDKKRHYKLLVIRATYRQLWSTTIPDFLGVFPKEMGDWSGGKGGPVTFVMEFEDEHGPIVFTAEFMAFGDDIVAALRGYQATDIWLHEMDTNPEDVLGNGITRINRYPAKSHFDGYARALRDYGQIVGDMNAPDEDNYTYRIFYDEVRRTEITTELNTMLPEGATPIKISFHRQPGFGEPGCENLRNLGDAYYPTQIATQKLMGRGDLVDRLVYNKVTYLRVGEPVFKREFNRRIHVSEGPLKLISGLPLRIGLDQGFKAAAVVCQYTPAGQWRFYAELHFPEERLMAKVFGDRLFDLLEDRFRGYRVEAGWGDMAGEHGASQAADENETWNRLCGKAAGFIIRPQRIGTNRIQPRLEGVRAALEAPLQAGQPGWIADPSMKYLNRGFESRYVWTDAINKNGDKTKVPDKSFTEANVHDAAQYVVLSEHRADGTSKISFPDNHRSRLGHNGGPPMSGQNRGLQTGYDIHNPYGGR